MRELVTLLTLWGLSFQIMQYGIVNQPKPSGGGGGGTITSVQIANSGSTAVNCAPTCSLTVTSTGSGHLGVIAYYSQSISGSFPFYISSVSGGGAWVSNGACRVQDTVTGTSVDLAYVLATTSGTTSISVTLTNNDSNATFAFYEYSAASSFSLGACTTLASQPSSANPTSPSFTTSATNSVGVTVLATVGIGYGTTTVTGTGCTTPYRVGLPTIPQSATDDILNVAAGTYQCTFTGYAGGETYASAVLSFHD